MTGGWEFDVPAATKPSTGRVTIFATHPDAFMNGKTDLLLASDHNPTVVIYLQPNVQAKVRGVVLDGHGKATGAQVSIAGYSTEATTTGPSGNFELNAHAADGQQVLLHVERGRRTANEWHPAGNNAITIQLW